MATIADNAPSADKAALRRQQVLDAAAECFRQQGFHGTSIARISMTAGMSAGHIYHYFDSKDAIVEAIAKREEHDISELAWRIEGDTAGGSVAERLMRLVDDSIDRFLDPQYVQLHLELAAEGSRNPAIHRILKQSDGIVIKQFLAAAERVGLPRGINRDEMKRRMMMISTVFNGIMVRVATGQSADRKSTVRLVKRLIKSLLDEDATSAS